jgi:hypothetical protein
MPRRKRFAPLVVLAACLSGGGPPAFPAAGEAADGDPQAPATQQGILKRDVGEWDATIQILSGEDGSLGVYNGLETAVLEPGGRWLVSDFTSRIEGAPFEGHALFGYDAARRKFTRLWVDSTQAFFWVSEGDYEPATDSLTLWMESIDSAGERVRWRTVTTWKDEATRLFTMHLPGPATVEAAGMTITYKRRSGAPSATPPGGQGGGTAPPTESHAVLHRLLGEWSAQVETAGTAGGDPERFRATESARSCCGGQFVLASLGGRGKSSPPGGRGIYGFDPARGRYIMAWADRQATALITGAGEYDAASDTLTFTCEMPDGRGGVRMAKEILTWDGPDRRTRSVVDADGAAAPRTVVRYRRR